MGPTASSILSALLSLDAEERRLATSRFAELAPAEAIPLLVRALGDEDWRVRKEATVAARGIAPDSGLVEAMIAVLHDGDDNVGLRNAAVAVLVAAGPASTTKLYAALRSLDADGRKLAVEALGGGGDPAALGPLETTLARDEDDNVREAAAEAIARLGSIAPARVQEILLQSLDDRDRMVSLTSLQGLTALRATTPWERLAPLFDDPTLRGAAIAAASLSDRAEAAQAVARELGRARGAPFVHALTALAQLAEGPLAGCVQSALRDEGPELGARLTALALDAEQPTTLRAMALRLAAAAHAEDAAFAAFAALSEEMLASSARNALRILGAPALPAMLEYLTDATAMVEVRAQLVDLLAEIGAHRGAEAASVLAALRGACGDGERAVAAGALNALARLGDASDLALIAEATLSPQRGIASAAEGALFVLAGRFRQAARASLKQLTESEPHHLAAALVIGALAANGAPESEDAAFLAHVATTGDTDARRAAVLAVAEIDGAVAMEVLSFALTDEEREVRFAAARALGRRCVALASPSPSEILDLVERTGASDLVAATVRAVGEGMSLVFSERRFAPTTLPPPELISVLALFARGAPSAVALAAVDALGQTIAAGTLAACDSIAAALEHPDPSVAKAAAFKLTETTLGRDALGRSLDHPSPNVRLLAAEMLGEVDITGARAQLTRRALVETDREVLAAIERALSPGPRAFASLGSQTSQDSVPPPSGPPMSWRRR